MKMKLLDYALISVLAGMAPLALAQDETQPAQDPAGTATPVDCTDDTCTGEDGLLLRLHIR